MEVRGIEPLSETRSTTASTCVSRRLRSPAAGRRAAHDRTSRLEFRPTADDAPPDYPGFSIPDAPPRAGFTSGTAGATRRLRGERQVVVGDCGFPGCFTRSPSTWARCHGFTSPVEASHPRWSRPVARSHRPDGPAAPRDRSCDSIHYTHRAGSGNVRTAVRTPGGASGVATRGATPPRRSARTDRDRPPRPRRRAAARAARGTARRSPRPRRSRSRRAAAAAGRPSSAAP